MTNSLPILPLGTSTFSALRNGNEIYVDKTEMIARLAGNGRGKVFLARPRRFGKSLLVSSFKSLFRYGLRDFRGLRLEGLWTDRTYDVLHLDFAMAKEFRSRESFLKRFDLLIDRAAADTGLHVEPSADGPVARLEAFFAACPEESLVLLIDEYDAPLTAHLDDPELFESVREELSNFYESVKHYEGRLRFFFMTGVTKVSDTSIFSGFNNLNDISFDTEYGTLLGYTEEEITASFGAHLERARTVLGLSKEELLRRMRERYDGFSFDKAGVSHVYCPWSVLNFLAKPRDGLQNFWYESGGRPMVLLKYLKARGKLLPETFEGEKTVPLSLLKSGKPYGQLSPAALLFQTGYLTIRAEAAKDTVRIGYPNLEVADGMARLFADMMLGEEDRSPSGILDVPAKLAEADDEEILASLNRLFATVSYDAYPVRDESTLRFGLHMLLLGGAMMPRAEVHGALGRSDLEVRAGKRYWVFELKFARKAEEVESLLERGVEQIRSRRHGEGVERAELHRVALVFDGENRRFAGWRRAD